MRKLLFLTLLFSAIMTARAGDWLAGYSHDSPDDECRAWLSATRDKDAFIRARAGLALAVFDRSRLGDPETGAEALESPRPGDGLREARYRYFLSSGSQEAADKFFAAENLVDAWALVGPCGRFERASLFEKFPPEDGVSLEEKFTADRREFAWRKLPGGHYPVRPWQWMPAVRGVVYLYTRVTSARAQKLTMEVRAGCRWRGWFAGREIRFADAPAYKDAAGKTAKFENCSQTWVNTLEIDVPAGEFPLLLKLYPYPAAAAGGHAVAVSFPGGAVSFAAADVTTKPQPVKITDAGVPGFLAAAPATQDSQQDSHWRGLAAEYLRDWESAGAQWESFCPARAAAAFARADTLPAGKRQSQAKALLGEALKKSPDCVAALVGLGEYERGRRHYREAGEYFARALQTNPRSPQALAAAVRLAADAGWREEAKSALRRLQDAWPASAAAARAQIRCGEKFENYADVFIGAQRLCALEPWDAGHYFLLAAASLPAGKAAEALVTVESAPAALTATPLLRRLRGQLLGVLGKHAAAEQTFREAAQAGGGAEAWHETGRERLLLGDQEGAAAAFTECLKQAPDKHGIRLLSQELLGENPEFWKSAAMDAGKAVKDFEKRKSPGGRTARLIDQTVLQVYPDGSYANYTHGLQAVLTEGGVRTASKVERYGEVLEARTVLPERGVSLEPVLLEGEDELLMPAVAPGAYIENKYLDTAEARPSRTLRFPQWFFRSPNSEEAFMVSQYVVRVPAGVPFAYAARNLGPNIDFKENTEEDGTRVYTWTARNMNRALHEEGGLAIEEALPFVKVGSPAPWTDVNRMLANYYLGKISAVGKNNGVTRIIRGLEEEWAAGLTGKGPAEKTDAGAPDKRRWMVDQIFRYVCENIEMTPWRAPATHIIGQGSGDRLLPLLALLRHAGIPAKLAAVRPGRDFLHEPVWDIPEAGIFPEMLATVPDGNGGRLWLYPGWRDARPGEIPETLAGATAYIVDPVNGGEFATLPAADPESHTAETARHGGFAGFRGTLTLRGAAAGAFKEKYAEAGNPVRRVRLLEEKLAPGLPGLAIRPESLENRSAPGLHFSVSFTAAQDQGTRLRADGARGMALGFAPLELLPAEDFSNRKTPFHLRTPVAVRDTLTAAPAKMRVDKLPEDVIIRNEFGTYQLTFRRGEAGEVIVRRQAYFPAQRVSLRQWKNYYQMAETIRAHENALLWWQEEK